MARIDLSLVILILSLPTLLGLDLKLLQELVDLRRHVGNFQHVIFCGADQDDEAVTLKVQNSRE